MVGGYNPYTLGISYTIGTMRQPNPYTPGAGDRPRALVGRSDQLALAQSVRSQIEAGYAANSLMYVGLRGVGKTVLLKEISDQFSRSGWYAPYLEMRRGAPVDAAFAEAAARFATLLPLGSKLKRQMDALLRRGGGLQVLASGASLGSGRSTGGYSELTKVIETLAGSAREDGVGVALLVDELQSLSKTNLGALVHLVQDVRDRLPFAFIGAGLPYLPSYIAKAATYTERFRYEPTDNLPDAEARSAIVEPARGEGVEWDGDALEALVGSANGYPYFIQLSAFEAWEVAARSGRIEQISLADVQAAKPAVERQKETGIYGARFDQVTDGERRYLYAMLDLMHTGRIEEVRSGDVARSLGRAISAVSPTREALIRKGVIHAPEHGLVAFSLPGFLNYLARRLDREG
jgi:hypothetical protein